MSQEYPAIVVGGGFSGIISAALLAEAQVANSSNSDQVFSSPVLLLESNPCTLGGCIQDVKYNLDEGFSRVEVKARSNSDDKNNTGTSGHADSGASEIPVVPAGSVEINPTQTRILDLCKDFKVECDKVRYTDCAIVDGQRCNVDDDQISGFPKTRVEAEKFRFVGDFESTDQRRYEEFCSMDVFDAYNYYPKRGLSELLQRIVDWTSTEHSTEFRLGCTVETFTYDPEEKRYTVHVRQTPGQSQNTVVLTTPVLILAVPPNALQKMKLPTYSKPNSPMAPTREEETESRENAKSHASDVLSWLLSQDWLHGSKGIPVTTITMWFDKLWWKDLSFQRIWNKYNPLLHVEFFGGSEQRRAKAIRASFADGSASERWKEEAFRSDQYRGAGASVPAVEEMMSALREFFDYPVVGASSNLQSGDSSRPNIPAMPLHTHVEHFPSAWHFEHLSSSTDLWEKQRLAMDLPSVPGYDSDLFGNGLHLVGEAYNPQRVWIQGALESVMLSLVPKFIGDENLEKGKCFLGTTMPDLERGAGTTMATPQTVGASTTSQGPRKISHNISVGGFHRNFSPQGTEEISRREDFEHEGVGEKITELNSASWETVVVGGGISGLMSAATILKENVSKPLVSSSSYEGPVAVLEASGDVGGCIRDVLFNTETDTFAPVYCAAGFEKSQQGAEPASSLTAETAAKQLPVIPAGCIRIPPIHERLVALASFLGVEWDAAAYVNCAVVDGERVCPDPDTLEKNPALPLKSVATELGIDVPETAEEQQLSRFVGDYESVDRKQYRTFAEQDVSSSVNFYPRRGLSEIPSKLVDIIRCLSPSSQPQDPIQVNSQVVSIQWLDASSQYQLEVVKAPTNEKSCIYCKNLILAVPPASFSAMGGPIPKLLSQQPFIRESKPIRVTTIAMWFSPLVEDKEEKCSQEPSYWWKNLPFHRIWNRASPLIHLELFNETVSPSCPRRPGLRVCFADGSAAENLAQLALSTLEGKGGEEFSPTNDAMCSSSFGTHLNQSYRLGRNKSLVDKVILELKRMFPDRAELIPQAPLHTHIEEFSSAWHFEHSNATVDLYTKQELARDLRDPRHSYYNTLGRVKDGENRNGSDNVSTEIAREQVEKTVNSILGNSIHLVGEAYNPKRAWIEGALESVELSLCPKFAPTLFGVPSSFASSYTTKEAAFSTNENKAGSDQNFHHSVVSNKKIDAIQNINNNNNTSMKDQRLLSPTSPAAFVKSC